MSAIRYYKEPNGDFLAVDMSAISRHAANASYTIFEGRATAIAGLVTSVCTTGISGAFLASCTRVSKRRVPKEWHKAIGA